MWGTLVFNVAIAIGCGQETGQPQAAPPDITPKVAEWLQAKASFNRDEIRSELGKLGAPIVPALQKLVTDRSPAMGLALQVLCEIGEAARPALPQILEVLGNREFVEPPGAPPNGTVRELLFHSIRNAGWAADDVVPVLAKVAEDAKETDWFKTTAAYGLGKMGRAALPVLSRWIADEQGDQRLRGIALVSLRESGVDAPELVRKIAENPKDPLQDSALYTLAAMEERAGRMSQREFFADLIRRDPFNEKVRGWLMTAKGIQNLQRIDPLTQEVKQRWRARLAEKPDAQLALQLAMLVQDQFSCSELGFCSTRMYWPKEDPADNYATMAESLRVAQSHAEKRTPLWQRATLGLAKIALLRGDWEEMNAVLAELSQPPVANDLRPWLTPPPKDWTALAEHWKACDPKMREGDCAFEVRVEKDGRGMRGAHILVRTMPPDTGVHSTGIDMRTLFESPTPLTDDRVHAESGFGYAGHDREQSRYAVTDDSGIARFEKLPPIEITIEVMIPTANFTEPGSCWDLWTRAGDDPLELDHYRWREGFTLKSGETVQAPHLVVRPHLAMNLADGQAITAPGFELTWPQLPETDATGKIAYELDVALSFPAGKGLLRGADSMARLATAKAETSEHSWPLGTKGVGELKLVPGNVYLVQVLAKDSKGRLVARFGSIACYVPWSHREASMPLFSRTRDPSLLFDEMPPIDAKVWHLGKFAGGKSSRVETLPERLDRYLREQPEAFEFEYARVAREWLRWREGAPADQAAARATLDELARSLPEGNVAADTARELVRRIDAHADPGKQLDFVAISK